MPRMNFEFNLSHVWDLCEVKPGCGELLCANDDSVPQMNSEAIFDVLLIESHRLCGKATSSAPHNCIKFSSDVITGQSFSISQPGPVEQDAFDSHSLAFPFHPMQVF